MSRLLTAIFIAAIVSATARAADPLPTLSDDERRAEDKALRSSAADESFRKQLEEWNGKTPGREDPEFRKRVDRILKEELPAEAPEPPKADPVKEEVPKETPKTSPQRASSPSGASAPVSSAAMGAFLWTLIIIVAAIVLAAIIYVLVTAWIQSRIVPETESKPADSAAPAVRGGAAPPIRREPDEWLAEARRLAAAGRWLEALRCLLFASLERLHRARFVDYERARTNRECVRAFRGPEDRRAQFGSLVEAFDATVYGDQPFGEAEYAKAEAAARDLGKGAGDESGA